MITAIRKSFQSKSYKIVIWITILALAGVFSIPQLIRDLRTSTWVAKVNGAQIPYTDFVFKARAQEARIQMLRQQYGQLADLLLQSLGVSADPKIFALEMLIKEELIAEVAQRMNLRVSPTFVSEKLASPTFVQQELSDLVPVFVMDPYAGINMQALRAYLQRLRISMSDFEDKVDRVIERKTLMDLVNGALYLPDFVLKEQYRAEYLAKRYSILHFNFGDYVTKAKASPASLEQLKTFYEQNTKDSKRYWMPEQRAGKVWAFDADTYGVAVDEDAIEAYYNDRKKSEFIETPLQVQVRRILFKIDKDQDAQAIYEKAQALREELLKDPAQFAKKAQELSQDIESAKQGGLLPFFERGSKHKAFDRAAFLLQNDGDISDVVVTDDGVELIQRVSKKPATFKPLSAVRNEIEKTLRAKKFKELFTKDMQAVVSSGMQEPAVLKKSKSEVINLTSADETPRTKALFRVKKEGEFSFYVEGNKGYLVQATAIKKPYLPTFEALKDTIERDYYEEVAASMLKRDLEHAKELSKNTSFADLKKQFNITMDHTGLVKPSDAETMKQLQKKGLPVDKITKLMNEGSVVAIPTDFDGYLVRLDEVEPFNQQEFEHKREELKKQLYGEYARMLAEGFVASLGRNATITINESLLTAGQ